MKLLLELYYHFTISKKKKKYFNKVFLFVIEIDMRKLEKFNTIVNTYNNILGEVKHRLSLKMAINQRGYGPRL